VRSPAGLGDLLVSGFAIPARLHRELLLQLAVTQDLHRLLHVGDQTLLVQRRGVDRRSVVELVEVDQVHNMEAALEVLVREAALGETLVDFRLAAFVTSADVRADARARAFVSAAAGLPATAALAATFALSSLV